MWPNHLSHSPPSEVEDVRTVIISFQNIAKKYQWVQTKGFHRTSSKKHNLFMYIYVVHNFEVTFSVLILILIFCMEIVLNNFFPLGTPRNY